MLLLFYFGLICSVVLPLLELFAWGTIKINRRKLVIWAENGKIPEEPEEGKERGHNSRWAVSSQA